MLNQIDSFILYIATERGLPENYQLSTRNSLKTFAKWLKKDREITDTSELSKNSSATT